MLSTRLLPGRSGMSSVPSSSTRTNPGPSPRGEASQFPAVSHVLNTKNGLRFIDLETCCRGPVEFDLAHVPDEVSERYPNADRALLDECRQLVLAMVAAWRWDPGDEFPDGRRAGREILNALRDGPPWPTLDVVMSRLDGPSAAH